MRSSASIILPIGFGPCFWRAAFFLCPVPDRIDGAGGRAFTMLCSIGEPKDQTERVRKGLFLPIPGGGLNAGHRRKETSPPPRTAGIFGPRCPRRSTRPPWSCPTGGPASFRNMYFFGEHMFSFYNAKNERVWCKFHHPRPCGAGYRQHQVPPRGPLLPGRSCLGTAAA